MDKLRWGILSTGKIARRLATALSTSESGILQAVSSRDTAKARQFAADFGGIRAHESHEDLLQDSTVDAVYIAMPHPQHAEWSVKAAQAGKHILCEKPAAMTEAEASSAIEAARQHGVFFMEAFMYRCHPQTAKLLALLGEGAIGDIGLIVCSFGFAAPYERTHRLFARSAGGGATLDVGCYCVSMSRLLAGVARGKAFAEPLEVKAIGQLDPQEGTDLFSTAVLKFPDNIIAQVSTGLNLRLENVVRIFGSTGVITVHQPWMAGNKGARIVIEPHHGESTSINTESEGDLYHHELDTAARYRAEGQAPAMTWDDTLGNMRTLDRWRAAIGLTYP